MAIDVDALKAGADIVAIVGSYVALKKQGQEYRGLCVFHEDHDPSMYVVPAKGLVHCFACGASHDVISFLQEVENIYFQEACAKLGNGKTWKPKPITQSAPPLPDRVTTKPPPDAGEPDMATHQLGEPSLVWPYRDAAGEVIGYVARYETPEGKQIRCWTWGARGRADPTWGCGHFSKQRPIYGLDRLADRPHVPVLIVEGEKACGAAVELLPSYACIAWPGGANAWKHVDWEPLRARNVLLWPDADEPGAECMARLADLLAGGLGCSVRIIDPLMTPEGDASVEIPTGWDAYNAQAEGWTTDQVIAWAKPRAHDYVAVQQNPAPQVAEPGDQDPAAAGNGQADDALPSSSPPPAVSGPVQDALGTPTASAEPPPTTDTDFPAGASTKPPRKRRLRVAGGTDIAAPDTYAEPLPAELSEDAMSDEFATQHGEDWRCVKAWGQWMHWDGDAWCEDRDDSRVEPMRALYRCALYTPEGRRLTPDGQRKLGRQAVAYASLRYAGTDPRIRSTPEIWDMDPYMLGVPGGVVDLREGKLIESAREQHITMRCAVAPERGPCETWLQTLAYWLGDDQDVIGFLRRYLGYALTGDGREQCMAFFYGPAASGKGTIMRLISYILGSIPPPGNSKFRSYHYEAPIATFLESRNDRHSTELAAMHQKRLITSEEPAAGARWDEAKIKWLTGGSFVTARFMRGDNFSFSMTGKIIVAANHRPRLATTDASIKRRMHVIPFDHPVADEDRDNNLDARLRAEAPQILNWLIEACLEWQQSGLGLPEKISASTETYLQAEDVLAQWIDEACERSSDSESAALYKCYCRWADEQGEKVWSRRAWANALVERGFKTRRGTAGVRMFCDLAPKLGAAPEQGYQVP